MTDVGTFQKRFSSLSPIGTGWIAYVRDPRLPWPARPARSALALVYLSLPDLEFVPCLAPYFECADGLQSAAEALVGQLDTDSGLRLVLACLLSQCAVLDNRHHPFAEADGGALLVRPHSVCRLCLDWFLS